MDLVTSKEKMLTLLTKKQQTVFFLHTQMVMCQTCSSLFLNKMPLHWVTSIYFFEIAIALSGYLNAINPFDQPGVEAYKKNMFALLGKPGFEELGAELNARL